MKQQTILHIPKPCHENWDAMTEADKGRHCQSCNKIVVDFSVMTDRQVLEHFKTTTGNTCGRFYNDQLQRPLIEPKPAPTRWKYFIAACLSFVISKLSFAQTKPKLMGKPAIAQPNTKGEVKPPVKNQTKLVPKPVVSLGKVKCAEPIETRIDVTKGDVRPMIIEKIDTPTGVGKSRIKRQSMGAAVALTPKDFERPITYTGFVKDEKGAGIPGAVVQYDKSKIITKADGSFTFSIDNFDNQKEIIVTNIGYETVKYDFFPIDYLFRQSQLVIVLHETVMMGEIVFMSKQNNVKPTSFSGIVKDEKGNTIPNASIKVVNKNIGATSNATGEFELKQISQMNNLTIKVSCVGYEEREITINKIDLKNKQTFVLKSKADELQTVTVSGGISKICIKNGYLSSSQIQKPNTIIDTVKSTCIKPIQKLLNIEQFTVYPNPASKGSTIKINVKDAGEYDLLLHDASSNIISIISITINAKQETSEFILPANISSGNYFIRLVNKANNKQFTQKLIVL